MRLSRQCEKVKRLMLGCWNGILIMWSPCRLGMTSSIRVSNLASSALKETMSSPHNDITPEAYNLVIEHTVPIDVQVTSCDWARMETQQPGAAFRTEAVAEGPRVVGSSTIAPRVVTTLEQGFAFRVVEDSGIPLLAGQATLRVRVAHDFEPPTTFWPLFLVRNLKLYTQPVLRDLVANICQRAGVPASLLPSIAVNMIVPAPVADNTTALPQASDIGSIGG